jgi:predicted phosphodiesterase
MKTYAVLFLLLLGFIHAADIYIVFTANVNGILEDCHCGNEPLGGIARLKTFFSEFEQKHPNAIFIDGGDFLNPYKYTYLNQIMSELLYYLPYDVLTPGDQEFIEGYSFFQMHLQRYQSIYLASNCNFGRKRITRNINNIPVTIVSYLSPLCFSFITKPEQVDIDTVPAVPYDVGQKEELTILIYHGETRYAEKFINKSQEIDLVLMGHAQRLDSWKFNETFFVGGGLDTELVMIIAASKTDSGWQFDVRSHRMDQSVAEDDQVKKIIEQRKPGKKK